MKEPAPIALFAYNRPDHLRLTVEALQKNSLAGESLLFVFSDGPKNDSDLPAVEAVRQYCEYIRGFKQTSLIERPTNLGLAQSIIMGVEQTVREWHRIIVLEDDMITSPHFLRFMNEALQCYETTEKVVSIHGYSYPTGEKLPETFFLRGADCWGWATWKRGWDLFQEDGTMLLCQLLKQNLAWRFDMDGAFPYTQMLRNQVLGKNDSWAIRWHASAFLADKLTLYPGKALVRNIGIDNSGTHCSKSDCFDVSLCNQPVPVEKSEVVESEIAFEAFKRFLKSTHRNDLKKRVIGFLNFIAGRVYLGKH